MKTIKSEFIGTDATGKDFYRCIIVSESAPDSFPTSGSDVDGVPDTAGIAAGSVLLTPDGNSVLYTDDWGEGGAISLTFTNELVGDDAAFMYMTEPDPSKATTVVVAPASTEKVDNIEAGIYVFIPLGDSQEVSYTGSVTEDTTSAPGVTLYICNGNATFTIQTK